MCYADKESIVTGWFTEYYALLMKICLRMLTGRPELVGFAEDAVQEVFFIAYVKFERLKDHPNIGGWFVMTCKNILMHIIEKHGRQERKHIFSLDDKEQKEKIHSIDDHDAWIERMENTAVISEVFKMLVPNEQILFFEYFVIGHSASELAIMHQMTVGAIKTSLWRIRKKIILQKNKYL